MQLKVLNFIHYKISDEDVESLRTAVPVFVCFLQQDTGADGINWRDSETAPIEIEIVDAGTDCKCFFKVTTLSGCWNLCLLKKSVSSFRSRGCGKGWGRFNHTGELSVTQPVHRWTNGGTVI